MWGKIYPHAVLLIFTNIIFKASCKGNGSLTFLIDDTSSMGDDIKQVIRSVNRIKDIVLYEKSSLIDNMVLVTFNDPGVHDRIVTKNPNNFKRALNAIKAHNEGKPSELDCLEPSMKGLLQALDKSNKDSYIFVFTDAPAKDYIDSHSVIEMCQKKQTQIVFVLTGTLCAKFRYAPEAINVYFDIAVACSGLAFFVNKAEVDKVFGPIEEIIKGNKTVITTATVPADVSQNIPFAIDDYTDYVIVSASGKNVTLEISKNLVSQKEVMSTDNAKVIKLSNAKPGNYFVTVKGKTRTSVIIVGRTDFFFINGFSKSKPKSMGDTSPQATADATVYLAIHVTDDKHAVKIVSAHLLDKDGKQILKELPLTEISKDFYITDPFLAPSQSFKVALVGTVIATGKPINRTAKLPITPVRPKIAPKIQGAADITVRKGETAVFKCKIESGFPAPKITWLFGGKSGSKFTPIAGSKSVLTIQNVEDKHEGKYKCVAENEVAKDEHVTTLFLKDLPKIVSSVSSSYLSTEGDALLRIPCVVTGLPKPRITWKLNGRVISPSAKYSIEDGALIIRDPKVSDTNSYTCEAKNEVGTDTATFRTYIRQALQVIGVTAKTVRTGSSASIECTVVKGEQKPKISWQFKDSSSSKFLPIPGSDKVLHISRVEIKHAGRYKCVSMNKVGSNEHTTTLVVQDISKIVSNASVIYESTEGDALLKIPCVAAGLPKPTITWKLNGYVINSSAKYSIEDGALIIRDPKVSDTNSYTCEAKNEVGIDKATFRTYIRQAPQVSGVTAKTVRTGSSTSIECTVVKGEPKPTISWQYMGNSSSKFFQLTGTGRVLHISRVENKHAGRYKCVAQNSIASNEHITTLVVQDLSTKSFHVSTIYQETEGDASLKISCIATGLPKPTITWQLNGNIINPSAKYSTEDGTLTIRDLKASDINSYTCEVQNEVGTVSVTSKTYIRQLPKLSGVATKSVRIGTPANIECMIVKGEPKPIITWQFMDKSTSNYVNISGSENTLRIPSAEKKHAGLYKCVAQNDVGRDEHVTTLIVEFAPGITTNSSTIEGIEGDLALRIPCDVTGIPKPVITWKLKGATITPDAKYSIEDGALVILKPTERDSSLYTCEAKNSVGSVSATFQAIIEKLPKNLGTEHYVYLLKGETRKLKCEDYDSKSQSVQWFITQDAGNKEPNMQIVNAATNHDGNYTCRVSDKHGNTQTHTYVVDVGSAPEFLSDVNSITDWRGDISDITQNCDIEKNTKPIPVVQWRLNGKVLTDLNSLGVGTYTCNVTNVHGSALRRFDVKSIACLISRNLKDAQYMPLILNDEGSWHKLKNTDHYTVVEPEEKIILSCPSQKETSNTFNKFPKKKTLEAFCYKEDSFTVEGNVYKLSDLQCTNTIQPSVIRKNVKCSTETSELISVGYNVPGFLEAYQVCFDHEKNMPLYTRVLMTDTNNNGPSAGFNWSTYPGIGHEKAERGFTCKDTSSSCCYSKSQLVNAIDFNDGPAKKSTFIDPLNVIPAWLPCDSSMSSWEKINDMVRSQLSGYTNIAAWSGTHTLQAKNGAIIPRYLWKVARLEDDEVMAIVYVNDPSPTEKDIKCKTPEICDKYLDWLVTDKNTYCCSLPDFVKSFDIHGSDIGEPMDAVFDKIEKGT